jgi:DNA-binding NarL/FixJ family response regulator
MTTLILADDQPLVRSGFRTILDAQPDLTVLGEASDGAEAVALARQTTPDIVLMDIRMPRVDGIEATRQLTQLQLATRVIVLTTFDLDEYVFDALQAGAAGFLLKDVTRDDLVRAVRVIADGDALLAPSVTRRLIEQYVRHPRPAPIAEGTRLSRLTPRELEVLVLLARGMSNAEAAESLVVSEHTVKTHVASILAKLEVRDRVQAVIVAYESALVPPSS